MDAKRKLDKKKAIQVAVAKKKALKKSSADVSGTTAIEDVIDAGAIVKSLGDHIDTRMRDIGVDEDLDAELFEDRGRQLREAAAVELGTAQRDLKALAQRLVEAASSSASSSAHTCFIGHNRNAVTCSAQIDDLIVYGDKSGAVYIYDIATHRKQFLTPSLATGPVLSMAISDTRSVRHNAASMERTTVDHSCPSYLAVGGSDGSIHVWKTFTREYVGELKRLHRSGVSGLAFRVATSTLYSASLDSTVRVWSVAEMLAVDRLFGHTDGILAIAALRKERAVTGGMDRSTRYWKIEAGSQVEYTAQSAPVETVAMLNDDTLVCGTAQGTLCVFDIGKVNPVCSVELAHGAGDYGDGTGLEREALSGLIQAPQVPSSTGLQIGNGINIVAAPVNSNILASGSHDGFVRVWHFTPRSNPKTVGDSATGPAEVIPAKLTLVGAIPVEGIITSLSFSADARRLVVVCSKEPRLGRWITKSGCLNGIRVFTLDAAILKSLDAATAASNAATFAPRGPTLKKPVTAKKPADVVKRSRDENDSEPDDDVMDDGYVEDDNDGIPDEDDMFAVGDDGQLIFKSGESASAVPSKSKKLKKSASKTEPEKKLKKAKKGRAATDDVVATKKKTSIKSVASEDNERPRKKKMLRKA